MLLKGNVLVVDDTKEIRLLFAAALKKRGVVVDLAVNGKEAVKMIILDPKKYRLILMDLAMPEMGGVEAIKCIRCELRSDVPILVITSHNLIPEYRKAKCREWGCEGYHEKMELILHQCKGLIEAVTPYMEA